MHNAHHGSKSTRKVFSAIARGNALGYLIVVPLVLKECFRRAVLTKRMAKRQRPHELGVVHRCSFGGVSKPAFAKLCVKWLRHHASATSTNGVHHPAV